jgi:NAD(P)-dependent dehydrogenase (short-subunit alcohol dehydrogenase family)
VRQQGGEAHFVAADVTKSAEVRAYVEAALDAYGAIDCFFKNAGIEGKWAHTAEYDEDMFDTVIGVNVKGVFLGLRHVLPVMLQQKRGAIVNTASVAGLVATPGMPAYVASKHAVIGLTKTAAGEVARQDIRVNAVCPGPVDTRMIHSLEAQLNPADPASVSRRYQSAIPIGRYVTPDEIANTVLFLCSDLASAITGARRRRRPHRDRRCGDAGDAALSSGCLDRFADLKTRSEANACPTGRGRPRYPTEMSKAGHSPKRAMRSASSGDTVGWLIPWRQRSCECALEGTHDSRRRAAESARV